MSQSVENDARLQEQIRGVIVDEIGKRCGQIPDVHPRLLEGIEAAARIIVTSVNAAAVRSSRVIPPALDLDSIMAEYVGPPIPHEAIAIILDMVEARLTARCDRRRGLPVSGEVSPVDTDLATAVAVEVAIQNLGPGRANDALARAAVAAVRAAGWVPVETLRSASEALDEARDDIQARIVMFRSLNADEQYMSGLNDAWGLVANRAREALTQTTAPEASS